MKFETRIKLTTKSTADYLKEKINFKSNESLYALNELDTGGITLYITSDNITEFNDAVTTVLNTMNDAPSRYFGFYCEDLDMHFSIKQLLNRLKEVSQFHYDVLSNEQYDGKELDEEFVNNYTDDEGISGARAIFKSILNTQQYGSFVVKYPTNEYDGYGAFLGICVKDINEYRETDDTYDIMAGIARLIALECTLVTSETFVPAMRWIEA